MARGRAIVPWASALMLLPSLLLVALLLFVPLFQMVDASFRHQDFGVIQPEFTLDNYKEILSSPVYVRLFYETGWAAFLVTALCALIAYPLALTIVAANPRRKPLLLFMVAAPLLVNTVVRSYGWLLVLGNRGLLNSVLMALNLTDQPVQMTGNIFGFVVAATQVFLPFMALSLVASLESIDTRLLEASDILGAGTLRRFFRIVFPLSLPGLVTGSVLVFSLMLGAIVIPLLIGGSAIHYLSVEVYTDAIVLFDFPRAMALSVVLLLVVIAIYAAQSHIVGALRTNRDA